jgi:hypothetical protein
VWFVAAGLVGAIAVVPTACGDNQVYPFYAWEYDATRDCLVTASAVDVIAGPYPGQCIQLRCWYAPNGDYYVTDTACVAPADYEDETDDATGVCSEALKVYGRDGHDVCPALDGGGFGGSSS